jgi:hypothetical protein
MGGYDLRRSGLWDVFLVTLSDVKTAQLGEAIESDCGFYERAWFIFGLSNKRLAS